jgi:hypothetical protein
LNNNMLFWEESKMQKIQFYPKLVTINQIGSMLLAFCLAAAPVHARNPYRKNFFNVYSSAKNTRLDNVPSNLGHCGVCHNNFDGGGARNPYGLAVQATDRSEAAILSLDGDDSDGDGFSNGLEITDTISYDNTPTFPGLTPGNIGSVSNVSVGEIQNHLVPSSGVDTTPPDVTVDSPDGGETLTANAATTILWTATDASGVAGVDIYFSDDDGISYRTVALGLENTGSYSWHPANRPTTEGIISIEAIDNAFNTGQDESDAVFTVQSPTAGPTTLRDFDMPGTQPFEAGTLNDPVGCAVCHGDYDKSVEPYSNWQGSMMAQASYDPLFKANMAIANQDAPDSGDLCLRCHFSRGWLDGRSVPTDGSAMLPEDHSGLSCDLCHRLVDPISDPENPAEDTAILNALSFPGFEFGNGMFVVDPVGARRGPFFDADGGHPVLVSPFHQEAALCGTCHDVSNPAFEWDVGSGKYLPNAWDAPATDFSPQNLLPVERTYSEWLNSAFNSPSGVYSLYFGGNKTFVSTCQDCHMPDVTGYGCNFGSPPERDDLPLHDLTGGSTWLPTVLSTMYPVDVNDPDIVAGADRARYMLEYAADLDVSQSGKQLSVIVINNTGHKLPTGYPEGRRMWLNVKFYDESVSLIAESGVYDTGTGVLTKDDDIKVYEVLPGIGPDVAALTGLAEGKSFHFVLNNMVVKDNRIPPQGFTNTAFEDFGGAPVDSNYVDGQFWDDTYYAIPLDATSVQVTLYYQSTSKEFVEFLRDENITNSAGQEMYDLWNENGKCPPDIMAQAQVSVVINLCDFDADLDVDYADFVILMAAWQTSTGEPGWDLNCDVSPNGTIDLQDVLVFAGEWMWGTF